MNQPLTKFEIRHRSAELRSVLCEFDPIGVMGDPESPRDEYDCMIGPLLTILLQGSSRSDVAEFVQRELTDHFGLEPELAACVTFAEVLVSWHKAYWVSRDAMVTIYIYLDDEGTPVWRPVQARPLGGMSFRIIGPDPRALEETWEFPLGSVVRCEERTFAGTELELVAIELLRSPPIRPAGSV